MQQLPEPHLKTQWLEYFVMLCQEQDLFQAAQKLGVSRQTLQRKLDALEAQVQTPLIKKSGKDFHLTSAGRILLQEAESLLRQMQCIKYQLQTYHQESLQGVVSFAWQSATSLTFLPEVLIDFMRSHSEVFLQVECQPQLSEITQRLVAGSLDLAVTDQPPSETQIHTTISQRSPFVIVSAPQPWGHWSSFAYVIPWGNPSVQRRNPRWNESRYPRQIVCETDSFDALLDWCLTGKAAAFLPQMMVQKYLDQGTLAVVADPPELSFKELYLCLSPLSTEKTAVQTLFRHLHQSMRIILPGKDP
jgi:DNA-binding transcriptional LysR family regulator